MTNGMVKWFNTNKGYGFIQPDNGNKDVFVHISAVEKSGLKTLLENQKVSFEINQDKGRSSAANIKVIGWWKKKLFKNPSFAYQINVWLLTAFPVRGRGNWMRTKIVQFKY